MAIQDIAFSSGYITITREGGAPTRYPIADVLRALDIPTGLTYEQVSGVQALANLFGIVIKALVENDILPEDFADDYKFDHIIQAIEGQGADLLNPDLFPE